MSASPILSARELKKSFGSLDVLKGVNMDIHPGEKICLWGPSGAGKSTLLHVMGLMSEPTGGVLELKGVDTRKLSAAAKAKARSETMGFLFQFHHLLADLSLLENVMIPLLIRRVEWNAARAKAAELLDRLGLSHRLHHRPVEASGGEVQRAALARALVGEPAVLFADEPTGNLDSRNGKEVEQLLKEEVERRGAALVLVTHNESLAKMAERVWVVTDGRLEKHA